MKFILFFILNQTFSYPILLIPQDPFEFFGIGEGSLFSLNPARAVDSHKDFTNLCLYNWLIDSKIGSATYWNGKLRGGLSVSYLDYGKFEYYEKATDFPVYIYHPNSFIISTYFARRLDIEIALGAGIKYVQENILQYSSSNFLLDMGLFFIPRKLKELKIEGELRNFGFSSGYNLNFPNPTYIEGSLEYSIKKSSVRLSYIMGFWSKKYSYQKCRIGLSIPFKEILVLYTGFSLPDDLGVFSLGLKIKISQFSLNYSYRPSVDFNDIHIIGIELGEKDAGF